MVDGVEFTFQLEPELALWNTTYEFKRLRTLGYMKRAHSETCVGIFCPYGPVNVCVAGPAFS